MHKLYAASLLIVLLKISLAWGIESSLCGKLPQYNIPQLTHSHPTRQWPWHAAIFHLHDNSDPTYECGGTVISQNWILTACHCVFQNGVPMEPNKISVSLGRLNLSADESRSEQTINVTKIIGHEDYGPTYLANDIALVRLEHEAIFNYFVRPICVWQWNTDLSRVTEKYGTVVGWGITEMFESSTVLQEAHFEIVSHARCLVSNPDFYETYLTETNFCAGLRNGTSVCRGDSGGSMTFEEDGVYYIRGIVSSLPSKVNEVTKRSDCDTMQYAIYTDVAKFVQWISVTTGIHCQKIFRCARGIYWKREECKVDVHIKHSEWKCGIIFDETSGSTVRSLTISGGLEFVPDLSDAVIKFENLRLLSLANNKLKAVEKVCFIAFRKIKVLELLNNQIDHLDTNTFKGLDSLKTIRLDTNKLEALPEGLFQDNHELQRIDLDHNQLKELHVDVFKGLHNLENLYLYENQFEVLPEGLFRDNNRLQLISLHTNQLKELHVDLFKGLHNLTEIYLGINKLEILPEDVFRDNLHLQRIYIHTNQLKELHVDLFKGLHNLTQIYLYINKLEILPEGLFRDNNQLQLIVLYQNHLTKLHVDVFKELHNLTEIDLSTNKLEILPEGVFRQNLHLQRIDLDRNQLKKLHVDVFKGLHNLEIIFLYGNRFEILPERIFRDNHQLKLITLFQNQLRDLHVDEFFDTSLWTLNEINNELRTKCSK